jgi:hypothetical protein
MTVRELIERLKTFNQDLTVVISARHLDLPGLMDMTVIRDSGQTEEDVLALIPEE